MPNPRELLLPTLLAGAGVGALGARDAVAALRRPDLAVAAASPGCDDAPLYTFSGTVGGKWDTPGFWDPPGPPPAGARVAITRTLQQPLALQNGAQLCDLQLGAEGGGAEVALQVQGGAVAVSGELRVFSQASLQLAGDLGGPGVMDVRGGAVTFESGSITGMDVAVSQGGSFTLATPAAHILDSSQLTCDSPQAMHAEQSYGCVWSDGPLFLNAGAALAVDSGTFLWAAPEGQQLLSEDGSGSVSVGSAGTLVVQPAGATIDTSVELPLPTVVGEGGALLVQGCTLEVTHGGLLLQGGAALDASGGQSPAAVSVAASFNVSAGASVAAGDAAITLSGGGSMLLEGSLTSGGVAVEGGELEVRSSAAAVPSLTIDFGGRVTAEAAHVDELFFYTGYWSGDATVGAATFNTPNGLSGTKAIADGELTCAAAAFHDDAGSGTTVLTLARASLRLAGDAQADAPLTISGDEQSAPPSPG